ncbi:MAG: hypothetical protein ABEH47_03045 [Haloferacaceae archaeon]
MDCEAFHRLADEYLDGAPGRARERVGDRCLVDFFHPATRARLGDGVAVSGFYRSGVVWHPVGRLLSVELRVPEDCDAAVDEALAAAPGDHERSAHRAATTAGGDVLSLVHHRLRCPDADEAAVRRVLDAVAAALLIGEGERGDPRG